MRQVIHLTESFLTEQYTYRPQDELPGHVVFDVNATDDDVDTQNKNITYTFGDSTDPDSDPESIKNTFAIDPVSGTVTLVTYVDRENITAYYVSSNVQVPIHIKLVCFAKFGSNHN